MYKEKYEIWKQSKSYKKRKNISRVELADMIGVSVKTMYNYENKITKISSDDLKKNIKCP
ncbi:helix-turn-helix domain-containing protein [Campylobacter hyointestinalis]|uniref:Helix-turn-helix transcriptional regulator n=1 Tax=Campylobacter hyointestinalis subsp. lawsonii TaxID=91353 RepID=A0AAV6EDE8_CAMHY|nr:helix-turn-helix transcriptional regulator [Campylobacter hyointestinalis subsp. lawsonii]RAZ28243.1 hypothetical protein CHLT_04995 [Campylobacter hyointestinalis subsp. lawsonii]